MRLSPGGTLTSRRLLVAGLAGLCAAGAFAAWMTGRQPRPAPAPPPDDPRVTFPTPYRNVRPGVQYVGDDACARCHEDVVNSYRRHPMGRSLGPVASVAARQRYGREDGNPFEAGGLRFRVEHRGDRVVHHEDFPDEKGRPVVEAEEEMRYVIGSGTRTFSYLSERGGCLFESPITWYSQKGRWGLSPGYAPRFGHMERPVGPRCLFCHCDGVEPVEGSLNRYREPTFRGMAIGCERCHGPGELHARDPGRRDPSTGADLTIVNPRRLEPALRDAVCQQCHLQGVLRSVRRGRGPFDYRPGLPLQLFWTVFVKARQSGKDLRFVSHVEQLRASRCARSSGGRLGCTTCHDPHAYPPRREREARYRAACLKCHHGESGCRLPAPRRRAKGDSCVACHMQRAPSDVDHTAITDHRITVPNGPDAGAPAASGAPPWPPVVPFHADPAGLSPQERSYDLAVALASLPAEKVGLREADLLARAKPLLDEALGRWPDDVAAREARAYALESAGRPAEALADCEAALARAPGREVALAQAARLCEALGRPDDAAAYWKRALAINPTFSHYHLGLGKLYAARGDWPRAAAECRAALRFNPAHWPTRSLLAYALARGGDGEQARAEFARVMALKPPEAQRLRAAFDELLRSSEPRGGDPRRK